MSNQFKQDLLLDIGSDISQTVDTQVARQPDGSFRAWCVYYPTIEAAASDETLALSALQERIDAAARDNEFLPSY